MGSSPTTGTKITKSPIRQESGTFLCFTDLLSFFQSRRRWQRTDKNDAQKPLLATKTATKMATICRPSRRLFLFPEKACDFGLSFRLTRSSQPNINTVKRCPIFPAAPFLNLPLGDLQVITQRRERVPETVTGYLGHSCPFAGPFNVFKHRSCPNYYHGACLAVSGLQELQEARNHDRHGTR